MTVTLSLTGEVLELLDADLVEEVTDAWRFDGVVLATRESLVGEVLDEREPLDRKVPDSLASLMVLGRCLGASWLFGGEEPLERLGRLLRPAIQ